MNKINIDKSIFLYFYKKYRDYIIPIAVIIISFILLLQVTIPTLNNLSEREREVKFEKDKLAVLQNNLQILSQLNTQTLDSQLVTASNALPTEKNFAEVLNSVSISANKSGILLGDYEFQVGDLSKITIPSKGLPTLSLALIINGNVNSAAKFVSELYKSFPIAEVTNIQANGNSAALTIVFYYKPVNVAKIDETLPISNLSAADLATLREMSSWNNPRVLDIFIPLSPSPAATSSGSPL